MSDEIKVSREISAVRIPSGEKFAIPENTEVMITQSLGGSYTVVGAFGMARVNAEDADAIGQEVANKDHKIAAEEGKSLEDRVWEQLRMVYDPEIPVNIVDLGLVYQMDLKEAEDGKKRVEVQMTLTAPGCGMGPTIQADAQNRVMQLDEVTEAEVELVWEPAWDQGMISEVGKMKLGMM
ncbi:MAG: putative Fe-S cluster assembly protein SufT [Verrucomicrobiota bacterium]